MQEAIHPSPLNRMCWAIRLLTIVVAIALGGAIGWTQSTQGSILGTVKDAKGAVIQGALVTLTNTDAGVVRTTTTSGSGDYQFLDAVAAHYDVEVAAPGFENWKINGAQLAVRQQLRIDVSLAVGGVQQTVEVSGDNASAIETDSASINAVYSADDAINLPTNSRAGSNGTSGLSLIGTLPGVQTDGSGSSATYSLQGGLPFQTEVAVDGITVQSATGNSPIQDAFPSTDAIAEIRADGVLNNAEIGQPGEVTITSKGGTNKFHGSTYWYAQNQDFDAIQFGAGSKPHKVGNTFGARFSGPVVIPHLYDGHDKFFIYGGYEGYRFPQQAPNQYTVPTAAMKTGDFTDYTANGFTGLSNPFSGGSYGNALPSSAINSASKQFLQFFPDPNHVATLTNGGSVPTTSYVDGESPNYYVNQDDSQHSDQFDIRPDKYFGANQKFLLWGRYSYKNFPANSAEALNVPSAQNTNQNNSLTTSFNWTIKPNLINEFRFGFTLQKTGKSDSFNGTTFTQGLGLVGLQNLFYNGIPELDFGHLSSLNADRLTSLSQSKTYVYTDAVSWTKGKHNFRFGTDIRSLEAITPLGFNGSDNYGTFGYTNTGNAVGEFTGVDFADFLVGVPNNTFYDVVQQDNDGKSIHYHFYAQDEWKASPRLTVSYGVRYEYHPGYFDPHGDIGNFDPSLPLAGRAIYPDGKSSLLAQSFLESANACDADGVHNTNSAIVNGAPCMPVLTNSAAGFPSGLKKVPHLRFMPRFGIAYRPFNSDKTVFRGGYGIYNITMLGSNFYSLTGTLQAQTTQYVNTYNSNTHTIGYQWPNIYAGAGNGGCTTCYGQDYFGTANSTIWKDPYTEQWTASIDHDFGGGFAARVSYIGAETHDLVWAPDENSLPFSSTVSAYNQPNSARLFPNWGVINTRDTGANASYNSLQLDASHRLQHGLQFDTAFTWAKALADNQGPSSTSFAGESGGQRSTSILDRGADFGNVVGTRRLLWNTTALYDLPFGRGKQFGANMPRALDAVVGGWRLSNIFTWQSGAFLTPYFAGGEGDPSGTGSGLSSSLAGWTPTGRAQHADNVAGVGWKPSGQNRNNWINSGAFACPGMPSWTPGTACTTGAGYDQNGNALSPNPLPIGRFGNSQVGSIVGPSYINLNTGLVKTFSITEGLKLRAEGTFTNVLNHINLDESSMNLDLSSTSFGTLTKGLAPRVGQVSMRLEF
ncbi:TonB-dependent receptor [Acidicapsa acidisoli]|uniref:TonB-dependent receptor n=1 Tax=Acidicapsa acidisoli TaxID=1615681 RepID=UPI0021E0B6B2|nr:TonB-dependent receptor [Acidicapsa acidisoli]